MDLSRLKASPIGSVIPITGPDPATHEIIAAHAYLPASLPHTLTLSTSTWMTINTATAALARLDGAARLIPNPQLLRRPALRREAQSTSALEGTYASFADVLAADRENDTHLTAEIREILNFEEMAELAFSWPEDRPLTLSMLGELQSTLVRGTRGQLSDAGGLRDRIVVIGARGRGFAEARFVPPPPGDQLRAGLENLLAWIDDPPDLPTVVLAALTHYQFETLHPYSDGNGRLGRLLVIVQLLRGALIREPLLVVSPVVRAAPRRVSGRAAGSQLLRRMGRLDRVLRRGRRHRGGGVPTQGRAARRAAGEPPITRAGGGQTRGRGTPGRRPGRSPVREPRRRERSLLPLGAGASNAINTLVELDLLEPVAFRFSRGGQLYVARHVMSILSG